MKKPLRTLTLFSIFFVGSHVVSGTSDTHAITLSEEENQLKVMSFNLRTGNANDPSPHSWTERRPTIQSFLESEDADIIGTQEVHHYQVTDLDDDLTDYDWIGLGREGGTSGEFMAIYYKSDRFTPIESGHYWLSDTPDVVGSTSWGNSIPRMVTWAKFQEEDTDEQFYFINTHFDHQSTEAQRQSANLIASKITDYDENLPMILTGDFNVPIGSEPYETLTAENMFQDPWDYAETTMNEDLGTFNNFNDPTGGGADNKIDWVLTRNIQATSIEINDYRNNGQYPSDHYPVIVELELGEDVE